MKKLLIAIIAVLLVSCTSSAWIKNPYKNYSESEYICAVGYGYTEEDAAINAKRELVSLFGMSIEAVTSRVLSETFVDDGKGVSETYAEAFVAETSTGVSIDNLFGVKIAEKSIVDKKYVALAVMEKEPTINHYRNELPFMRASLDKSLMNLRESFGSFEAIELANRYYEEAEEYNLHVGVYNYISGSSWGLYDLAEARKTVLEARSSVSLAVSVEGDQNGAVEAALYELFADSSFKVADRNDNPTSIVSVKISWNEFQGIGNPFTFANYTVRASIVDASTGNAVFSFDFEGKEGHQTFDGAKTRAARAIVDVIESEFADKLFGKYLNGV